MIRIARIIEYFPPHIGGMERHGLILSREQVKLGHSVDIFIGFGANSGYDRLKIYKAPLQFLPLYSKVRRFWFNFWAIRQVVKRHKKNPYDIIHLHGDFIEAYFGGKLSKKLSVPAVMTIHAGLNKRLLKPKNAEYFKNIAKVICVSNEIAEDLKSIGIQERKIEIITSGVDLNEFDNADKNAIAKLRDQYSKPIIVSVGVLRVSKGFIHLIEAYKFIKQKHTSATLIIIGDGPEKNNLLGQIKNINDIYFFGRQNHGKIVEYLKSADIFVSSSVDLPQDREGTPTAIMEAMAAGLPVVATKVGGNPQLIKDNINGFLVNPQSPEELAEALIKLINGPDLSQKMGAQNFEDIKQKDWSVITKTITGVYQTLL